MHIPKRERKCTLRDVYAVEPVAPKFNPWSACPITFDRRDHQTRVLMDGGDSLTKVRWPWYSTQSLMDTISDESLWTSATAIT